MEFFFLLVKLFQLCEATLEYFIEEGLVFLPILGVLLSPLEESNRVALNACVQVHSQACLNYCFIYQSHPPAQIFQTFIWLSSTRCCQCQQVGWFFVPHLLQHLEFGIINIYWISKLSLNKHDKCSCSLEFLGQSLPEILFDHEMQNHTCFHMWLVQAVEHPSLKSDCWTQLAMQSSFDLSASFESLGQKGHQMDFENKDHLVMCIKFSLVSVIPFPQPPHKRISINLNQQHHATLHLSPGTDVCIDDCILSDLEWFPSVHEIQGFFSLFLLFLGDSLLHF